MSSSTQAFPQYGYTEDWATSQATSLEGNHQFQSYPVATLDQVATSRPNPPQDQPPTMKQKRSTPSKKRERFARNQTSPCVSIQEPGASKPGNDNQLSKLGQKKAELGTRMGNDYREKAPVKEENGVLFGLIDDEWSMLTRLDSVLAIETNSLIGPAIYHHEIRKNLILMDAHQVGAPSKLPHSANLTCELMRIAWDGIELNYISYSPITSVWTEDPHSVKDGEGQEVLYLTEPPAYWTHNPKCDSLMYEGLIVLDVNGRPIKAYPGAPLTLSVETPDYILLGLHRVFGMTMPE